MNRRGQAFQEAAGNILVIALVITAMISFVITTQYQNDASQSLGNNSLFNDTVTKLVNQLQDAENESALQQNLFNDEKPKQGFGSIVLFGIVPAVKTFSTNTYGFIGLIIRIPVVLFGIDPTIQNTVITWLIILLLIAIWLVYKLGG